MAHRATVTVLSMILQYLQLVQTGLQCSWIKDKVLFLEALNHMV